VKSPGFFKPRERHTKAQSSFFIYLFILLFLKSLPWNSLLADLIIVFLNSLSPQGFVLFTVPSSKQLLSSGAKQATYTIHSETFALTTVAFPRQTHTIFLRRAPSQPWGVPGWAQSTFYDEPNPAPPRQARLVQIRESRSVGPSPIGLLWRTRAPSQTDIVSLYIWWWQTIQYIKFYYFYITLLFIYIFIFIKLITLN